jgi:hypothetical protein
MHDGYQTRNDDEKGGLYPQSSADILMTLKQEDTKKMEKLL